MFHTVIAGASPALNLIAQQIQWRAESDSHEPHAERQAVYYALADDSQLQIVEDLLVIFLVVELGRRSTEFRQVRIRTLSYSTFGRVLSLALTEQLPGNLVEILSLRTEPRSLVARWANLKPSVALQDRHIMALRAMATIFDASLAIVAKTNPTLLAFPDANENGESIILLHEGEPTKRPTLKQRKFSVRGEKTGSILRIRASSVAASARSPEGRSQHTDELIESVDLTTVDLGGTPFAAISDVPERVERAIANDAYRRAYDWLFLAEQWTVLSSDEMCDCLTMLLQIVQKKRKEGDRTTTEAALLGILVGVTGRSPARILQATFNANAASGKVPTAQRDAFDLDSCIWRHVIPQTERRYRPRDAEKPLLVAV